ncbi:esterase [Paraclostridium bifermentans]|uniref:esterase n=1 Tax=Paraclostridium bifermentans TaxID=1490 RepID=UPI001FF31479|nr:esterase [Paraclostridium bifermentans]UOW66858.1 esterase [Paraclostridium bifermentans]
MQVTSLETLKQIKKTFVIELESFEDGTPFIAEVKRPNLMNLVASGKIPNTLLSSAMKVFKSGIGGAASDATEDAKALKELASLMVVIAENTLVNPSFKDLNDNEIELSEVQLVDIMKFMQNGIKGLESFRNKPECIEGNKPSE